MESPHPTYEELLAENQELKNRLQELSEQRDTIERLRGELADLKLQSKAVLNASSDTVTILDPVGTILAINDSGAMRLRGTPEQYAGTSIFDLIPQELAQKRKRWLHHAVETRKPIQFKDDYRGITYGHRLFPFFDDRTSAVRVAVLTRDISESEKALKALRESEARYRAILEDQTELICRYLPDGRLSYVNEAYARYFNKDRHELINRNFIPHIPEEDIRVMKHHTSSLSPEKPVTSFEHRVIMEGGELRWQHWTHRAIYDMAGSLTEYQAVGRDITQKRIAPERPERK